jgi:hypothetical protein
VNREEAREYLESLTPEQLADLDKRLFGQQERDVIEKFMALLERFAEKTVH